MAVDDESNLLRAAKAGDEEAFARLFERHAGLLSGRIRRVLPARMTRKVSVADILQEIRLSAFQRIGTLEAREAGFVRRWLMRILDHKVGDILRRYGGAAKRAGRAEVTRGQRPETCEVRGSEGTPSQAAIVAENRRLVRETMALLPDDYRKVLALVFEEQLSLRETAARMDRSHEAAKKLYGRALARLTDLYTRAHGGTSGG